MSKFIIENRSAIPDTDAIRRVVRVVEMGRISNSGENYCYATAFTDCVVITDKNMKSDRFIVTDLVEGE